MQSGYRSICNTSGRPFENCWAGLGATVNPDFSPIYKNGWKRGRQTVTRVWFAVPSSLPLLLSLLLFPRPSLTTNPSTSSSPPCATVRPITRHRRARRRVLDSNALSARSLIFSLFFCLCVSVRIPSFPTRSFLISLPLLFRLCRLSHCPALAPACLPIRPSPRHTARPGPRPLGLAASRASGQPPTRLLRMQDRCCELCALCAAAIGAADANLRQQQQRLALAPAPAPAPAAVLLGARLPPRQRRTTCSPALPDSHPFPARPSGARFDAYMSAQLPECEAFYSPLLAPPFSPTGLFACNPAPAPASAPARALAPAFTGASQAPSPPSLSASSAPLAPCPITSPAMLPTSVSAPSASRSRPSPRLIPRKRRALPSAKLCRDAPRRKRPRRYTATTAGAGAAKAATAVTDVTSAATASDAVVRAGDAPGNGGGGGAVATTPIVQLLDLPRDVLRVVLAHVMSAPRDGGQVIVTRCSLRASLPFAQSCRAAHAVWASSLQHVDVGLCATLTDADLLALSRSAGASLHRLSVRLCTSLTPPALAGIPDLCPRLRALDVSHTAIDDDALCAIVWATARDLTSLAVHACSNVTGRGLDEVTLVAPALRFLDVGQLPTAVDDRVLARLGVALGASLRTLVVSACPRLTDAACGAIAKHCPALASLTMRALPLVTDAGISTLCRGLGHQLHILDVLDCKGLTLGGYLSVLRLHCPFIYRHINPFANPVSTPHPTYYSTYFTGTTSMVSNSGRNINNMTAIGGVERSLRDCIIATMPGLIYRISATDAVRRLPALYFLLLDEGALRSFRIAVQGRSLNLSDFGSVLVSNFGRKPTHETRAVLRARFGHDSAFETDSDDESCVMRTITSPYSRQ